jgi:cytochrome c peroxidase
MWDGRESSLQTGTQKITFPTNPDDLLADLAHQSLDATSDHAQGSTHLTLQQQRAIVDFEMALGTAQAFDYRASRLDAGGATGGPVSLSTQTMPAFFIGINDPLGGNPRAIPFSPVIFNLFDAWTNRWHDRDDDDGERDDQERRRARILRILFNSKPIDITLLGGSLRHRFQRAPGGRVSPQCGSELQCTANHKIRLCR